MNLLPCPFCGGEAEVVRRNVEPQGDPWYGARNETFVLCKCGACLFDYFFHEGFTDKEQAVTAWNIRAKAAAQGGPTGSPAGASVPPSTLSEGT